MCVTLALTDTIRVNEAIRRLNKEDVYYRAYVAFRTEELVMRFSRDYDGHTYSNIEQIMHKENKSQAVVEFAPYLMLPLKTKEVDGWNVTIDQDEEFITFLESLEAPSTKPHDAD